MKAVFEYLKKLYLERKQISLLSCFYGVVAVAFVFIAGLCALVNQSFGVALLIIPLVALVALCANVTVWALIKLGIQHLTEIENESTSKTEDSGDAKKSEKKTNSSKSKSSKK